MEAEDIEKRDQVFHYVETQGLASSQSICKKFFPNHLSGEPTRYVRKILGVDPRFEEQDGGSWIIREFNNDEKPLKSIRYCVFDLETTGGVPPLHRIIEIGAVILEDGELKEEFSMLVNPERPLPEYVARLTGIKTEELEEGVAIEEALTKFLEYCKGCVFVAHNASFDVNFLRSEVKRVLNKTIEADNLCSLKLSKFLVRDSTAHKLEVMAKYFDVSLEERHRALSDARMTAKIFISLMDRLKDQGVDTLKAARKFGISCRENYFPRVLATPESLNELPQEPGVVYFHNESGKKLHAWPMMDVQESMKSLLYEGMTRTPFIKRLLKRSKSFSVEEHTCYLHALLHATRFSRQRGRDRELNKKEARTFYLKVFSISSAEIFITTRKLRDQAMYLGPFESLDKAKAMLKNSFTKGNLSQHRFPPKSGIEHVFNSRSSSVEQFVKQHAVYSNKSANLFLITPGEEATVQVSVIREGYLLKKRWLDLTKVDQNSLENFFREILKSYFKERSVNEMLTKLKPSRLNEYDVIMRWVVHHSQADRNCVVRFLRACELEPLKESLVTKLTNELIMEPYSDFFDS